RGQPVAALSNGVSRTSEDLNGPCIWENRAGYQVDKCFSCRLIDSQNREAAVARKGQPLDTERPEAVVVLEDAGEFEKRCLHAPRRRLTSSTTRLDSVR